jgi:membrane dipeptidase
MKIFDAHCDVLLKLWSEKLFPKGVTFDSEKELHISYPKLKDTGAKVQCFAIYIPEKLKGAAKFQVALEMVDIFYTEIINAYKDVKLILTKDDIDNLKANEIGAILTLEGCDAIENDIVKMNTLYRLGVRSVGLTWNYGNAVADGVLEERASGLSNFGKEFVQTLNHFKIWTDVSHLAEQGFWDVMELSDYIIASHSNAKSLCNHPRNLTDEQIQALISKNGIIGITFVPQFLSEDANATIQDVLFHIEHICSLGGEKHIGFGSDFDGIITTVKGLESYRGYENLINTLLKHYPEETVKGFGYNNFYNRIPF